MAISSNRHTLLLIVSNPPFLGAVGWILSVLRGQKYCILVYDLYPGILVNLGTSAEKGIIARTWRLFNSLVWSRAEKVFTIGDYMAANIRREMSYCADICVIPVWADVNFIRPLQKVDNSFIHSLGWMSRTIVLYSGNLGATHNLDTIISVASQLRDREDIGFLIIGSGSKWSSLCLSIEEHDLDNVKLLPFQPEYMLPFTLSAGDISIVSMESGLAGYMVPSKSYYYMAAGSALLAIMPPHNEIDDLVEQYGCGLRVNPGDSDALLEAIISLVENKKLLAQFKLQSRSIVVKKFSRDNTNQFIEALRPLV